MSTEELKDWAREIRETDCDAVLVIRAEHPGLAQFRGRHSRTDLRGFIKHPTADNAGFCFWSSSPEIIANLEHKGIVRERRQCHNIHMYAYSFVFERLGGGGVEDCMSSEMDLIGEMLKARYFVIDDWTISQHRKRRL